MDKKQETKTTSEVQPKERISNNERFNVADIVNSVLTLTAVVISFFSLRSTNQSVELTRQAIASADSGFQIENMPFLQCSDINFGSFEAGKQPVIFYTIHNFGKYPAKILEGKFGLLYSKTDPADPFQYIGPPIQSLLNSYIVKEIPYPARFSATNIVGKTYYDSVENGELHRYFFGEITYVNEITRKKRIYSFNARVLPDSANGFSMIKSENIDVN